MPQSTQEISDAKGNLSGAPKTSSGVSGTDPLAGLYKMSTTAGLGSAEYVAINGTAIAAALLGVASALTLMTPALLFIPLIGVVCAVVALVQIGGSNGTQSGKGLAVLGLALSVLLGGFVGGVEATASLRNRAERELIEQRIASFGEDVKAGRIGPLYDSTGSKFKAQVSRERFEAVMTSAKKNRLGTLVSITSNGLVDFSSDAQGETAVGTGLVKFDQTNEPMRETFVFRKIAGEWVLESLPVLFPQEQQRPGGPGGPSGSGAAPSGASGPPPAGTQGPPAP